MFALLKLIILRANLEQIFCITFRSYISTVKYTHNYNDLINLLSCLLIPSVTIYVDILMFKNKPVSQFPSFHP